MVLGYQVLRIIWAIKVLALRVLSRTGVVTSNDEMRSTEVLADYGVPYGFTGTSHAHREGKKSKVAHPVGVLGHDGFVDPDTGVVVDVTRLGETDDRVDEDVGLSLASRADGKFTVGAMHGVASLEGDDFPPSDLLEVCPQLSRCVWRKINKDYTA